MYVASYYYISSVCMCPHTTTDRYIDISISIYILEPLRYCVSSACIHLLYTLLQQRPLLQLTAKPSKACQHVSMSAASKACQQPVKHVSSY